jgi:Protein kinase domain
MTGPIALPVSGFRAESVLDQDRLATVWLVTEAGGRSGILTIGHRVLIEESTRVGFLNWAQALGRAAASPAIADLLASGLTADARPYIAVATQPGTLADRLVDGPFPPAQVRECGRVLANGLAAAHASGLVHGAVRPATVLMSGEDGPTLAGFGLTAPGLGEPLPVDAYTAPEHLGHALVGKVAASQPADIYALAVTLFVALGGRPPWADDPANALLRGQPFSSVAGVSATFLGLLQACVAVDPTGRPTAAAFERMLAAIEPGSGAGTPTSVDPAGLHSTGIRRVASSAVDHLTTGFAGALGGAVGTTVAARMLGPTAAPPPAAPPPGPPPATSPGPPPAAPPPGPSPAAETATGSTGSAGSGAGVIPGGATTSPVVKTITVIVVAVGVGAGGVYAYNQSADRSSESTTTTGMSIRPARADFGTVWPGTKLTQNLDIVNGGRSDATLEPAVVTGAGFALQQDNCSGRTIPPRGSCTIVVAAQLPERKRYAGELSVRTGQGMLKAPLTGQGDIADLAGTYALTRRSIDPRERPSGTASAAWDGGQVHTAWLARVGIELRARTDCGQPGCGYTYRPLSAGADSVPISPAGDGTLISREPYRNVIVRPERIENGLVVSLVLVEVTTVVIEFTATFDGVRRT